MSTCRIIPMGSVALVLLLGSTLRAEISADLSSVTSTLFVYEPFLVRLEVQCDAAPDTPQIPDVPQLTVTAVRRLPADPAQRKHAFEIELISERHGNLTVPPITVHSKGGTAQTAPLRLTVKKPRRASEMALDVQIEPTELWVGQPASLTVTWTSSVSFKRCKRLLFDIPLLRDARCNVFPLTPPDDADGEVGLPVNNIRVVAQKSGVDDKHQTLEFKYKLIPQQAGVLPASSAQIVCALLKQKPSSGDPPGYFYNHFFETTTSSDDYEEVYLAASVPRIIVRDVAAAERTPYFAGIVGPCSIQTSIKPTELTVGQPALFTVTLDNLSFARQIGRLPTAALSGLRADFQLSSGPIREESSDHTRSFTYTLRPLRTKIRRIPAVVIQIFDPDSQKYRTLRSNPLQVHVDAGPQEATLALSPRVDSESPVQLHGVRQNRNGVSLMMTTHDTLAFLGIYWWAFLAVPPLIWIVLRPLARRWDRCRRDPAYARAVSAWPRFRRNVTQDEEVAWRVYLADRLELRAESLTADTVTAALRARGVASDLIHDTRQRLEKKDAAEYGRRTSASVPDTLSLVRRLQKATVPIFAFFCLLLPAAVIASDQAGSRFEQAMQMREEKPDEAQPLFVEAALQFEADQQFLNAGNAWYFAGENGRALVNYRMAQRRAPFHGQLQESIAYLRANRVDSFPPPSAPTGTIAAFWRQYCTWTPTLRLGAFVIAYLIAWTVFLVSRLSSRRVHRLIWLLLLLAMVVPLLSLIQTSFAPSEGVIVTDSIARLGPGYAYDPAFKQPLHQATEFTWIETRQGWVHCRLPDDSEGWLRETSCMLIK